VSPKDKPLVWLSGEVKTPPFWTEARIEAGFLLRQLQAGRLLGMPHSRPMPGIGHQCHELRIQDAGHTWRIIYRVDADAIVIAEVFLQEAAKYAGSHHPGQPGSASTIRHHHPRRRLEMDASKRKRLERSGWTVGSVSDFLGLSSVEEELVEIKLALSAKLRKTREMGKLTQTDLAKRMGSSQSRVAKMEAGDPKVSLDLLVQGLLAAGATRRQIASALAQRKRAVGE
jgi:DNA-binding XRE family transcriptional regulator/phage-related protein